MKTVFPGGAQTHRLNPEIVLFSKKKKGCFLDGEGHSKQNMIVISRKEAAIRV